MKTHKQVLGHQPYLPKAAKWVLSWAFLACLLLGSLAAGSARATSTDPCAVGTIAAVLGTTCTIGDKTFDFTSYLSHNTGTFSTPNAAADVTFTPLTGNPLSPGFELGTAFNSTVGDNTLENGDLYYNVSVTDGSANLIGVNVIANNPTVLAVAVFPLMHAFAYIDVQNIVHNAIAEQTFSQTQVSGSPQFNFSGNTGPQAFAPVSSVSGEAFFETSAYNFNLSTQSYGGGATASATLSSVDYTFLEQNTPSPAPEPGTLVLFGSGLVCVAGLALRKIFSRA